MPFGLVARGSTQGGGVQSPIQTLNDFATLQGRMLDNQNKAQDLRAYDSLGQTIATSPPDQLYDNLRRNPGLARHPDIITHITNADLNTTNIAKARQEMTDSASSAWGKTLSVFYNDPNPTKERWDALVQAQADTISDPVARNNFILHSYDIGRSLYAGATSPDQVRQRILGQVAGTVGSWDAITGSIFGGKFDTIDGRPVFQPFSGPQGTLYPLQPSGGTPGGPLTPLGQAFGAPPSAIPAQPSAGALAPQPAGPDYGPGAVTASPLQPPGAAPAAPAVPPPGTTPAAPAPAPAPAPPVPAPGSAPAAPGAPGGAPAAAPPPVPPPTTGGPTVPPPAGSTLPPLTASQMRADGSMPAGSLAGRSPDKTLVPNPMTGATGFEPAVQPAVEHRLEQFRDAEHGDLSKFDAAQQITANTAYIRDAFNRLQQAGGWMTPGVGATYRADALRRINVVRGILGMDPLNKAAEADFTELQKQQVQLGFTNLSNFFGHGREAAQTIETSLAAVPGGENSFLGGQLVNRTIEAMAQREMRRYKFMDQWQSENHGSLAGADEAFSQLDSAEATAQKVLGEFGMGARGFEGATPQETDQNLQTAVKNGILTPDEGVNLRNHRPADWKQTETKLPGGGVSAPIPPYTPPRMP